MTRSWKYVLATFAVSWAAVGVFVALGGDWNTVPAMIFAIGYMLVPGGVGLVFARFDADRNPSEVLGLHFSFNWWWAFAWVIPVVVSLLAFGLALLFPGVDLAAGAEGLIGRFGDQLSSREIEEMRRMIDWVPAPVLLLVLVVQGMIAGATINGLAALGEEAGWRGYLYDTWRSMGFWRYSAAVGTVWGIWHAPLILQGHNYPEHPEIGAGMMVLFCLLYSPVLTFARDRCGSSIAAALLHGTINGTAGIALLFLDGGSDLLVGITGLAGLITLAAVDAGIAALRRAGPVQSGRD